MWHRASARYFLTHAHAMAIRVEFRPMTSSPLITAASGVRRIVLTGGPGAGKTTIAFHLAAAHPGEFMAVPEAATQVYSALQTRWDRLDMDGRRDAQRRIYRLQLEQEQLHADASHGRTLLLDRGTVDGSAYWPDGPNDYWRAVGSSRETELSRYDCVVWMESCAAVGAYDGAASNACRHESADEAIKTGERLARVWADHPRFHRVAAHPAFERKIAAVMGLIRSASSK
jgi:predicted ATPase